MLNDIKSDSTCLTSPTTGEGEEGADLLVRSCLGASGDFTAICANDHCAVCGMYLTRGSGEEGNKTDNNVYWASNQSASVSHADTVLPLWDSKPALPWAPNLCSDNHLAYMQACSCPQREQQHKLCCSSAAGNCEDVLHLKTCALHCCILKYQHIIWGYYKCYSKLPCLAEWRKRPTGHIDEGCVSVALHHCFSCNVTSSSDLWK